MTDPQQPTSRRPSFAETYAQVQAGLGKLPDEPNAQAETNEPQRNTRPVFALVVVDAQNDFAEGGALGVDGAIQAFRNTYRHVAGSAGKYSVIVTTRDAHIDPGEHWSENPDFVNSWPRHCAESEAGSEIHAEMHRALDYFAVINPQAVRIDVAKGAYEAAYSGFEGVTEAQVPLAEALRSTEVQNLDVVGVATDHCVRATVLDALKEGFTVRVFTDQIAAVSAESGDAALAEMEAAGAEIIR
ncbi:isochorismatase family protein [Corynebacterium sp. H113]|uniref:isochorismatase family protein n=1 Tax=Corynebacterium sp. H113 TaxID=3133419 RepID=UPI0030A2273A